MFKVDLHTHSTASHDGGIGLAQYEKVLASGTLDAIAITDHNRIDFAQAAQNLLGDKVIVGEEIMTTEGEIIGLYLNEVIPAGLTPTDTVAAIKNQGGIVYIPHPFETIRKGLHPQIIEQLQDDINIIEVCNGRAFAQNKSKQTVVWSRLNNVPGAASSDAHGVQGLGGTYNDCRELPTKHTLTELIATASLVTKRPKMRALLYPKYHKVRKKVTKDRS